LVARLAKAFVVSIIIAAAIMGIASLIQYKGGTYTPYSNEPGEQYSTLQKGIPLSYYNEYTLSLCSLRPGGGDTCNLFLPTTFSDMVVGLDFVFWTAVCFALLLSLPIFGMKSAPRD
jgi:ABC-type transport system involved in multi-copper enzyme maturation permease subunit